MLRSSIERGFALLLLVSLAIAPDIVRSQDLVFDPESPINDYISIGEFNQNGELEGWVANASTLSVANGVLSVTATGADPHFDRAGIAGAQADWPMVEFRIRVLSTDGGVWQLFWGETAAPGFAEAHSVVRAALTGDSEFHVYQYNLSPTLTSALTAIRLDTGAVAGTRIEVDYARIGTISPDSDADGLPDNVETDTGTFVGPRDTGTDPDNPDTDGDGFGDGEEVEIGTDPTDAGDFPTGAINGYTVSEAVYAVEAEIAPNDPVVVGGIPTGFEIAPPLPSGLDIDPLTGQITGFPEDVSPATDYVVTATFPGDVTDDTTIGIEIRNPFVTYPFDDVVLAVGDSIAPIGAAVFGAAPVEYEVDPNLPTDLILDAASGEFSGTLTEVLAQTEYTVTAIYKDFPESTYSFFLTVLGNPQLTIDPLETINDYVQVGEFDQNGDLEGWLANASSLSVANGLLDVTTTGGDPHFFRTGIPGTLPEMGIVEYRYRVIKNDGVGWQLFWGEEVAGGFAGGRSFAHAAPFADGFHVYQYDLSQVISSGLTDVRLDPGAGPGTRLEVDYVRIGTNSPDTDEDGLPDTVETNAGFFTSRRDTGTDPDNPDTDEDGFDDGVEVELGTDPTDPGDAPVSTLLGYTQSQAVYIIDQPIDPNDPVVGFGTPILFEIDPALPDGLEIDADTGTIMGAPTEETAATDYVVTATFMGGSVDQTTINLRTTNPFISYPVANSTFVTGRIAPPLTPAVVGPVPDGYEIDPELPLDLFIDPATGVISGTPLTGIPPTEFTVTATYAAYPDSSATLMITIVGEPVLTVDPEDPLPAQEFSLGEFDNADDILPMAANNMNLTVDADAGLLLAEASGPDPYVFNLVEALTARCTVVEARIRIQPGGATNWQVFWAEDAPNRNFGAPGQPLSLTGESDGEFHVYRFDFTEASVAPLIAWRLDPGDGIGTTLEIDYVRFGNCESVGTSFVRGDADASGQINITDGIFILNFLFLGGDDPSCKDAADADDSNAINITDGIYVLNFLFLGGPNPGAPYPDCGPDPDDDIEVDCLTSHEACL